MRTLELASGNVYDCDWCGAVGGVLVSLEQDIYNDQIDGRN